MYDGMTFRSFRYFSKKYTLGRDPEAVEATPETDGAETE